MTPLPSLFRQLKNAVRPLLHSANILRKLYGTKNKYDYVQNWELPSDGFSTATKVHYQFFEDRVSVTILEASFTPANGKLIQLNDHETMIEKKNVYDSLENAMVTIFFTYLQTTGSKVTVNKKSTWNTKNYDSVTKRYLEKNSREKSKKLATEYIDTVLKDAYEVKYLGSTPEDNLYSVKYTLDNEEGTQTVVVNYKFRATDFDINIDKINYFNKTEKKTSLITKNNATEKEQKNYELLKNFFLDKHSDYISTGEYHEY